MTAAHLWFYAFIAASTLLVIALGAYSDLAKENRRLRAAVHPSRRVLVGEQR